MVFFAVYVVTVALSLPIAVVLSLVGGALFGRWLGTGVVSVAATAGATLAFLSSRYLLRDWVQRRFARLLGPLNDGVAHDGIFYLFTLRLMPVVPFWLINLGMGLTPMRDDLRRRVVGGHAAGHVSVRQRRCGGGDGSGGDGLAGGAGVVEAARLAGTAGRRAAVDPVGRTADGDKAISDGTRMNADRYGFTRIRHKNNSSV